MILSLSTDAIPSRMGWMHGVSPCLSRSRFDGHWISHLQRKFSTNEMLRLQGMQPCRLSSSVSASELGKQIGNAMSVNVIQRVLHNGLYHTGHISGDSANDPWHTGTAILSLHQQQEIMAHVTDIIPQPYPTYHNTIIDNLPNTTNNRRFLVDSGASVHIINKNELSADELTKITTCPALTLQTANGKIYIDEQISLHIPEFGISVRAYALKGTTNILSVGKLIHDHDMRTSHDRQNGWIILHSSRQNFSVQDEF